jgi:molybdenum cofactor cytidylyltransferase
VIAAVVLAAGASQRLGQPKQLVEIGGETLLHRAISTAIEALLDPVIVVVNQSQRVESLQAMGAKITVNLRSSMGMATSIHAGVHSASALNVSGIVIMACDQPTLTADHLRKLITHPDTMSGSGYAGRIGIPAYFPASEFNALMQLRGDTGAREMLRNARPIVAEHLELDIDTQADLNHARDLFG